MDELKTVKLPSGAVLKITPSPFADAKALYQAILEEARGLKLDPLSEIDVNLWKDLVCVGFSSKKIEAALAKCMERATYNDLKMDKDTFEPVAARDDYLTVCLEVTKENVMPFMKSLYAQYANILKMVPKNPA